MTTGLSDRERIAPDYIREGLSLDAEFFNRLIRGLALYNGIDPQTVNPPHLRLERGAGAQITLADFTDPPFRRLGRRANAFANSPANAGNASYVQLIQPPDSGVIAVVTDIVYTCAVAVNIFAGWNPEPSLANPGNAFQPPLIETQTQGSASGTPPGLRKLNLAPLLLIASNPPPVSTTYTQLGAPGAATVFADLPLGLVMWPGMDMWVGGSAINNALAVTYRVKLYDLPSTVPEYIFP